MAKAWRTQGLDCDGAFVDNARRVIDTRLREALSYEERARDGGDVAGLHNMRISVKRLRYSMELFQACFAKRFRRCLARMRDLQELLGATHDADVRVGYLRAQLERAAPEQRLGVKALLNRTQQRREETHRQVCEMLEGLRDDGVWRDIRKLAGGSQ